MPLHPACSTCVTWLFKSTCSFSKRSTQTPVIGGIPTRVTCKLKNLQVEVFKAGVDYVQWLLGD